MLAIIPARGGSKRLPGKNIRMLLGKPLIAWTIEAARASNVIDRVVCTSDDPSILVIARSFGCETPFLRPAELARDDTSSLAVVRHALDSLGIGDENVMLLQPTSPLRTSGDIDAAARLFAGSAFDGCISVTKTKTLPESTFEIGGNGSLQPIAAATSAPSCQTVPARYVPNGAIYVHPAAKLRAEGFSFLGGRLAAYVMPADRSVDIDEESDFIIAEALLSRQLSGSQA